MAMKSKNFWILLICMLAGLTIGNFIGDLCNSVSFLSFLNYSQSFGLDTPFTIDLGMLVMTIQFQLKFTLAGILGMLVGVAAYQKI